MKHKAMIWLFLFAGILWMIVGLRDAFAPGFFSFSGRVVTGGDLAMDFAVAAVFLALAGYTAIRSRQLDGNGK